MEYLAVAGLAVLCLYAWRYGHIIVGVCGLFAVGVYLFALTTGAASLPGANVAPFIVVGVLFAWVWRVT